MGSEKLNDIFEGCIFDMCLYEEDKNQQNYRCSTYEEFNNACLELAQEQSTLWTAYWRTATSCRK